MLWTHWPLYVPHAFGTNKLQQCSEQWKYLLMWILGRLGSYTVTWWWECFSVVGVIGSVEFATRVTLFEDIGWAEQTCCCANHQWDGILLNKIMLVNKINRT